MEKVQIIQKLPVNISSALTDIAGIGTMSPEASNHIWNNSDGNLASFRAGAEAGREDVVTGVAVGVGCVAATAGIIALIAHCFKD